MTSELLCRHISYTRKLLPRKCQKQERSISKRVYCFVTFHILKISPMSGVLRVLLFRSITFRNGRRPLTRSSNSADSQNSIHQKLEHALENYEDFKFRPLRVGACIFGRSFYNTKPGIEVFDYVEDNEGNVVRPEWLTREDIDKQRVRSFFVDFGSLFNSGFNTLKKLIERPETVSEKEKLIIESLGQQLLLRTEYHQERLGSFLVKNYKDLSDTEITTTLTLHLLSLLVTERTGGYTYIVADDVDNMFRQCPCLCGEPLHYGKTDIGSQYLWFGRPDIMLFPDGGSACQIYVKTYSNFSTVEELEPEEIHQQPVEVNLRDSVLRKSDCVEQRVRQSITFSFYRKKYQLLRGWGYQPIVSAIPTIVIGPKGFDMYIYDTVNDILLRNLKTTIPIWEDNDIKSKKFDMSAVLQLWLAVNHLTAKPSFTSEELLALEGSAGFLPQIDGIRMEKVQATLGMKTEYEQSDIDLIDQVPLFPASMKIHHNDSLYCT